MIRATANTDAGDRMIARIKLALTDKSFDKPVEIAAWRTRTALIAATPKGWTGNTRRNWTILKTNDSERLIFNSTDGNPANPNKIMLWLEKGTGNAGTPTSNGGYIYPKTARLLFIPLTSTAAVGGWTPGMKFGTDYVLAKRVRGIKAMRIVENMRPKARALLQAEMKSFLQKVIK